MFTATFSQLFRDSFYKFLVYVPGRIPLTYICLSSFLSTHRCVSLRWSFLRICVQTTWRAFRKSCRRYCRIVDYVKVPLHRARKTGEMTLPEVQAHCPCVVRVLQQDGSMSNTRIFGRATAEVCVGYKAVGGAIRKAGYYVLVTKAIHRNELAPYTTICNTITRKASFACDKSDIKFTGNRKA